MAFGVQDDRRVTLTAGTQTGWCLQSALRYGVSTEAEVVFSVFLQTAPATAVSVTGNAIQL